MTSNRQGRLRVLALVPLFFTAALAVPQAAGAQATRYLVSGVGDDVNLCSRTAPCKAWAGAISKTADGGEINALDSGGFGAVTITTSITLDGNGAHASILACGANGGVTVNTINDPTDKVTLRALRINGCRGGATVAGTYGVNAVRVGSLRIEDTRIFGFEQAGVRLETNNLKARAVIEDTRIYNNGNYGVLACPAAGTDLRATLHDTGSTTTATVSWRAPSTRRSRRGCSTRWSPTAGSTRAPATASGRRAAPRRCGSATRGSAGTPRGSRRRTAR